MEECERAGDDERERERAAMEERERAGGNERERERERAAADEVRECERERAALEEREREWEATDELTTVDK